MMDKIVIAKWENSRPHNNRLNIHWNKKWHIAFTTVKSSVQKKIKNTIDSGGPIATICGRSPIYYVYCCARKAKIVDELKLREMVKAGKICKECYNTYKRVVTVLHNRKEATQRYELGRN